MWLPFLCVNVSGLLARSFVPQGEEIPSGLKDPVSLPLVRLKGSHVLDSEIRKKGWNLTLALPTWWPNFSMLIN